MLYGDAANSFRLGENADRAILCLTRAGEAQLRKDPDGAVRSFKDAIALVFELERVTQSMDKVQNVLSLMVKAGRVAEALEVYRRLVEHYAKIAPSFFNILCRVRCESRAHSGAPNALDLAFGSSALRSRSWGCPSWFCGSISTSTRRPRPILTASAPWMALRPRTRAALRQTLSMR
jgi:hypothetical protein